MTKTRRERTRLWARSTSAALTGRAPISVQRTAPGLFSCNCCFSFGEQMNSIDFTGFHFPTAARVSCVFELTSETRHTLCRARLWRLWWGICRRPSRLNTPRRRHRDCRHQHQHQNHSHSKTALQLPVPRRSWRSSCQSSHSTCRCRRAQPVMKR